MAVKPKQARLHGGHRTAGRPDDRCFLCRQDLAKCQAKDYYVSWEESSHAEALFNFGRSTPPYMKKYQCPWCTGWHLCSTDKIPIQPMTERLQRWLQRKSIEGGAPMSSVDLSPMSRFIELIERHDPRYPLSEETVESFIASVNIIEVRVGAYVRRIGGVAKAQAGLDQVWCVLVSLFEMGLVSQSQLDRCINALHRLIKAVQGCQ